MKEFCVGFALGASCAVFVAYLLDYLIYRIFGKHINFK